MTAPPVFPMEPVEAQEALLRALRFFPGFHGGDPRAWLLKIVRNASYTWLESHRRAELSEEFDEERHGEPAASVSGSPDHRPRRMRTPAGCAGTVADEVP